MKQQQLNITLTEPVVFLRSSDPSGRLVDSNDPSTIVRGVLTLSAPKPTAISSIDVELAGVSTVCYPEGIASRHTDHIEKRKIYSSTVTVFRADQVPHGKRPASIGPGSCIASVDKNNERAAANISHRISCPQNPSTRSGVTSTYPHGTLTGILPEPGPTPPYTPVTWSPHPTQSRLCPCGEGPVRTLEEPGRDSRDNLNRQAYQDGLGTISPRPHSSACYLRNSATACSPSIALSEPTHTASDDMSRPGPSSNTDASPPEGRPSVPRHRPSLSCPSHSQSHPNLSEGNPECSNAPAGRSRLRLSLNSVLDTVMGVTSKAPSMSRGVARSEEGERGRTRCRTVPDEQCTENVRLDESTRPGNSCQPRTNSCHSTVHMGQREQYLLNLGRVLGWERDKEKEEGSHQRLRNHREGLRVFQPGTYSFPVSFLLPPSLPATFSLPRGKLHYSIKAVAHRPGTFTSKLSCQVPLLVVAAPTAGAGEGGGGGDPGPLSIQRQWEGKLAYSFELSSRLFLLGSQRHLEMATNDDNHEDTESLVGDTVCAPAEATYGTAILNLTLLPLDKIKIWRLSIVVDQHISYFDTRKKLLRGEDKRQVKLVEVQDTCPAEETNLADEGAARKNKHSPVPIPLLPTPLSPHRSPLLRYACASADPSILAGPGPYALSATIGLPNCGDRGLRFTMKHNNSFVRVEHFLRLVMRVESAGDECTNDHEGGKKKKSFDITVQTPITVLSCRCSPEFQTLPKYSPSTEDDRPACPCQPSTTRLMEHEEVGNYPRSSISTSFESRSRVGSPYHQTDERHSTHTVSRPSTPSLVWRHVPTTGVGGASGASEASWDGPSAHSHVRCGVASTPYVQVMPQPSRPPSPLVRYERLVSGLESEAGEAPPCYEAIAAADA